MDKIKQIIIEIEKLKLEQKYTKAIEIIERALVTYN
jgi:hypothetical protein